jgi:MFS family permease
MEAASARPDPAGIRAAPAQHSAGTDLERQMAVNNENNQSPVIALYCLESFSRGMLLALVPLQLLEKVETAQNVTFFYALVSVFVLVNSTLVPFLVETFGIRPVVALAGALQVCAAGLLALDPVAFTAVGLVLRATGTSCLEIPLMTLIMQSIPRSQLSRFEPIRVVFAGVCMSISPWLGYQFYQHLWSYSPNLVAAMAAAAATAIALRFLPRGIPLRNTTKTPLGRQSMQRFVMQPRLFVAWLLAVARTSFWAVFYTYAPIFAVTCGWSPSSASALVSAGIATMILVPIWGYFVRRFGVRLILIAGYSLTGASLILAAAAATISPIVSPFLLFIATTAASINDGPGNVLFMRASRLRDRAAMTGLYMTYRDTGQFSPIALFSAVMLAFPLTAAFATLGVTYFGAALLSRTVHWRLR